MSKRFLSSISVLLLLALFVCPVSHAESAVVFFEEPTGGQAAIIFPDETVTDDPYQPGITVTTPTEASPAGPTLATGQNAASQGPTLANNQNASAVSSSAQVSSSGTPGVITGMYVRFRSAPSSDAEILGEYNQGKALTILGTQGQWTHCRIDSLEGFIFSQYVQASSSSTVSSPALSDQSGPQGLIIEYPAPVSPSSAAAPTLATAESAQSPQNDGTIIADHVRLRSGPSTDYSILGTYDHDTPLTFLGTQGDWTYCRVDGQDGYIFSDYVRINQSASTSQPSAPSGVPAPTLATGTPALTATPYNGPSVGYIKGNNVRFREAPDSASEILDELFYGNAVTITGIYGSWTAIVYNNQAGFVASEYVATGSAPASSSVGGTPTGRELADYALGYVGYPYTWGGKDPSTGFDCSGFMYYVFKHFGYTLNRVASEQAKNGRHIENSELQPGDLLCFYSGGGYIGHVGMYIGNNRFVHAGTSQTGVIISELDGYYISRGFEARRIIG